MGEAFLGLPAKRETGGSAKALPFFSCFLLMYNTMRRAFMSPDREKPFDAEERDNG